MRAGWSASSRPGTADFWIELRPAESADVRSGVRRRCGGRRCDAAAPLVPAALFNEGTLTINMLFNPGISLAESHRVGLIAERHIMEVPEVRQVGRRTVAPNSTSMPRASIPRK